MRTPTNSTYSFLDATGALSDEEFAAAKARLLS